jgi:hypothetical protein
MSCYEWERGTIKIPSKEWAAFRTGMLQCWNKHQLDLLERAKSLHARLKTLTKGKRGSKRAEAIRLALKDNHDWELRRLVVESAHGKGGVVYTLNASLPKKKDLGLLPTSKDARINVRGASITLCNKTREVTWEVAENNHAREHARSSFIGQELFRRLGKITWTRGTGGQFIGNDEYNRDEGGEYAGGGGSYVTATYSQAKQKQEKADRARDTGRHYGGGIHRPFW